MSRELILNNQNHVTQTTSIEQSRAIAEVQAMCVIARQFPRERNLVLRRIQDECAEKSLAKQSSYSFPRGGAEVTGPSIRLAETVANCYGNITYGVRVLGQDGDTVQVQAFCWDVETNVRKNNDFELKLEKKAGGGFKKITDPRDVYEHSSSQAQRRVRECILAVVSKSIVETAIAECEKTLNAEPIAARIEKLIKTFAEYKITEEMIKEKMGKNIDALNNADVTRLGRMYQSIKDGMAGVDAFFQPKGTSMSVASLKGPVDEPVIEVIEAAAKAFLPPKATDQEPIKTDIEDHIDPEAEPIEEADQSEIIFKKHEDAIKSYKNEKSLNSHFNYLSTKQDLEYLQKNNPVLFGQINLLKNNQLEMINHDK